MGNKNVSGNWRLILITRRSRASRTNDCVRIPVLNVPNGSPAEYWCNTVSMLRDLKMKCNPRPTETVIQIGGTTNKGCLFMLTNATGWALTNNFDSFDDGRNFGRPVWIRIHCWILRYMRTKILLKYSRRVLVLEYWARWRFWIYASTGDNGQNILLACDHVVPNWPSSSLSLPALWYIGRPMNFPSPWIMSPYGGLYPLQRCDLGI